MNLLSTEQLSALRQTIDEAQSIVITCHRSPDGDALGSSLAMASFLKEQGKDATIIIPDAYPDFLMWMPGTHEIVRYDKHPEKAEMLVKIADLIVCLDFNTLNRTGEEMEKVLLKSKASRILIDHHLDPDIEAKVVVSHPEMSSTSEMVFHIINQMGCYDSMNAQTATCIYCGMMTDTGAFTYNSTNPETYNVIAMLLAKGINKDKIYRNVYWVFSENRMRLWGHILQNFVVSEDGHASYFTISKADMKKYNFIKGDAEGLVNMPLQVRGMKLSVSLREDTEKPNLVWVSLRSVDDFPCNKMSAQYFNGGGHLNAAGGRLYCSLAEAVEVTKKAIKEFKY